MNVTNDLLPAIGTGALLLLVGAAFLLLGAVVFAGSPLAFSVWVLLLGGLVLASGLAIVLVQRRRAGARAAVVRPPPVPPAAAAPTLVLPAAVPAAASAPAASRGALAAPRAVQRAAAVGRPPSAPRSVSTSIPGAYLQSISPGLDLSPWPEAPPPVVAALPFSAGVPRSGPEGAGEGSGRAPGSEAVLELELARLRARVRELESPRPAGSPFPAGTSVARSGAVTALPRPGAEPPAPSNRPSIGARGCAGCGQGLPTARAPLLCWGCGRALCAGCFWRYGPGPGLHRCPDCLAKASGGAGDPVTGLSGGRSGISPVPGGRPTSGPAPPPGGR